MCQSARSVVVSCEDHSAKTTDSAKPSLCRGNNCQKSSAAEGIVIRLDAFCEQKGIVID
jgi:hypothetical protein